MAEGKHGLWWWVDRWRRSGAWMDMTLAEQGAYRNLLDEQRLRGGQIPNDERVLAKACGDPLEWPNVREKVLAKFVLGPGGWTNKTATEVNAVSDALLEIKAKGGRARAAAANRTGGRFTSSHQQKHQQEDQQTTSRSVAVAVSVAVPVTENNGPDAIASVAANGGEAPPPPKRTGKKTWLSPFGDAWQARWGEESEPPFGEMAKSFPRPYAELERDDFLARWVRFLAAAERPDWARPSRFVQGLGQWAEGMRPPARAGPKPSIGEQVMASAAEFLKGGKG